MIKNNLKYDLLHTVFKAVNDVEVKFFWEAITFSMITGRQC